MKRQSSEGSGLEQSLSGCDDGRGDSELTPAGSRGGRAPAIRYMTEREMIEIARPCVRNELNRCEQKILMIERSKPAPSHLNPAGYLEALNGEADRLRTTLDSIDKYLGL
jgi:hypothetical protein